MPSDLLDLEQLAVDATQLEAFSGLNLKNVRNGVEDLLGTIGQDGFFKEYSDHSFAHVLLSLIHI